VSIAAFELFKKELICWLQFKFMHLKLFRRQNGSSPVFHLNLMKISTSAEIDFSLSASFA
jgi:hypothetical protein